MDPLPMAPSCALDDAGLRLTVAVSQTEHEPALDAIAFALDLKIPPQYAAPD